MTRVEQDIRDEIAIWEAASRMIAAGEWTGLCHALTMGQGKNSNANRRASCYLDTLQPSACPGNGYWWPVGDRVSRINICQDRIAQLQDLLEEMAS